LLRTKSFAFIVFLAFFGTKFGDFAKLSPGGSKGMSESLNRAAGAAWYPGGYFDARVSGRWSRVLALEELLRVRIDEDLLRDFQERLGCVELPLETLLTLLEDSIDPSALLEAAQRLVAVRPRDADALRVLALAFGLNGQIPFAVASAQRAVKLVPHDSSVAEEYAHWQRLAGCLLANTAWLTKAALIFDELAEREPHQPDYPFQAGLIKNDLRLHRPAESSFKEAIARYPSHARAHRYLAESLRHQGRVFEAQHSFLRAGELFMLDARMALPARARLLCDSAREAYSMALSTGYSPAPFRVLIEKLDQLELELSAG
jgi:tetratricopeptide (TPR) repeat protein